MFGNILDGRLDQREHRGNTLIQIGESDGVDMGFIYRYLYLQIGVVECEGRGIDSGGILFLRMGICRLLFAAGPEHDDQQDDEQDAECGEYGSVNDFFHMQNYDFGFGTHESNLPKCIFYSVCQRGGKYTFGGVRNRKREDGSARGCVFRRGTVVKRDSDIRTERKMEV